MKAYFKKRNFLFKRPSGTSRGILHEKVSWFIFLEEEGRIGIGECGPLKGLSIDDKPSYEGKLWEVCKNINQYCQNINTDLEDWPSIRFGLECALMDYNSENKQILYPSKWTDGEDGIPINGLIWMGSVNFIKDQIKSLLDRGFHCLKMKIGAIDFEDEIEILKKLRSEFDEKDLILRVDANGAFQNSDALEKLKVLSNLNLHSIEQPIEAGQIEAMARLCEYSPLDIALDEELIPVTESIDRYNLLKQIKPQYIILKPSLLGGFDSSEEWINIASENNCGWWITSALESNIGLNAICQWTYILNPEGYQGLGTGSLYTNNIASPLEIKNESIYYNPMKEWRINEL